MINKRSLWFLTLFSLILVLSIYYITMPSELLISTPIKQNTTSEPTISVEQSDLFVSLRAEDESETEEVVNELQEILTNSESTVDEKNEAFSKIKEINNNRGEEEKLETKLKDTYDIQSYIKIDGDQIKVIAECEDTSSTMANNIMRTIQENFDTSKYITVKFQE